MSRTIEDAGLQSPVEKRITFNGKTGDVSYAPGSGGGDFTPVQLPFHFIILDASAFRITGKASGEEIKSNLGHSKHRPSIKVWKEIDMGPHRAKEKKDLAEGQWRDIKATVGNAGRFNNVVFGMDVVTGDIITVTFRGKGFAKWLNFLKECDSVFGKGKKDPAVNYSDCAVTIAGVESTPSSLGDDSYVPKLQMNKVTKQEVLQKADAADAVLQGYFKELFVSNKAEDDGEGSGIEGPAAEPNKAGANPAHVQDQEPPTDDLPF